MKPEMDLFTLISDMVLVNEKSSIHSLARLCMLSIYVEIPCALAGLHRAKEGIVGMSDPR